jgi:hypothetical protein
VPDPIIASELSNPCLGFLWLGSCRYNPGAPTSIYFSLGEVVGALAFTLAVQQLLKPIYRFRLSVRYLKVSHLYLCVFAGAAIAMVAALVPNFPILHGGPWGYAIVWEIAAATLFIVAYGAVALAIALPIRVRSHQMEPFARGAATLLSAANETDHVDLLPDLQRSLSVLIATASFSRSSKHTSAFFDFIFRHRIEQASYADSLLRIIADPLFCETIVKRTPWRVVSMLQELSERRLHVPGAEQFIRQLAHQAILRDDAIMAREVEYHGFGTAPLLSQALFSDPFVVVHYNPLYSFFTTSSQLVTASMLARFNHAAERCYKTLIREGHTYRAQVAFSVSHFYRSVSMRVWEIQATDDRDFRFSLQLHDGVKNAIHLADALLASLPQDDYDDLFVTNLAAHRSDVLETLVEIVYEFLTAIANRFKGFDDPFWMTAIEVFLDTFPTDQHEPIGMTPFQQRLAIKLIGKLDQNMEGWYPAICKVLLSCIGPYPQPLSRPSGTAFGILRDAMYAELQRLPRLAVTKPDKFADFLPDNVTYDVATRQLAHMYRGGNPTITDLTPLNLGPVSLIDPGIRRPLTDEERNRHVIDTQ